MSFVDIVARWLGAAIVAIAALSPCVTFADGLMGGGRLELHPPSECIPAWQRQHVAEQLADYEQRFGSFSPAASRGDPPPYVFFPMAGTLYRDLWTHNFVDLNPMPWAIRDWDCTKYTYNGHQGIDTIIRSFGEQAIGVPIFAAQDGVVAAAHDGEDDMNTEWGGQQANYVIIDHGSGREVWYWHMKKWSVAVSVGQVVRAGEQIGLTGSSGMSTWPHLHFETQDNGVVYEPYAGDCRAGPSGWVDQVPIKRELYLNDFGVTAEDLATHPGLPYALPRSGQIGLDDDMIRFWVVVLNLPAGSTWRVRFQRPDATTAFDSGDTSFSNSYDRASWWWWSYDIPDLHAITGTWRIELLLNGESMLSAPVEIRTQATPDFNRPPAPIDVAFDPPAPTTSDVIFCRVDTDLIFDDPDYDIVRYRYVWSVDGIAVRDVTAAAHSDALPHHSAEPGTVVECVVTPGDGQVDGPSASVAAVVARSCPADLDEDGAVGLQDLLHVLANYGTIDVAAWEDGDIYPVPVGDHSVNISDLGALLAVYNTACP